MCIDIGWKYIFVFLIIFKYEMLLINPMKYCILKEYM